MFFIPFIIGYVLCDVFFLMWDTARRLGVDDESHLQILTLHVWTIAYRTVTPVVISFLLERLYATVNNGYYERARPAFFILLLPLGLVMAIADDLGLTYEWFPTELEQYGLLGLEFFIALVGSSPRDRKTSISAAVHPPPGQPEPRLQINREGSRVDGQVSTGRERSSFEARHQGTLPVAVLLTLSPYFRWSYWMARLR